MNQQTTKIQIDFLPENEEQFLNLRNSIATTAEGGAAAFIIALKLLTMSNILGAKALILQMDKSQLQVDEHSYMGYQIPYKHWKLFETQLNANYYIPNSYILGSSPANRYQIELPYVIEFEFQKYAEISDIQKKKIFVKTSGSESIRPIVLKQNDKGIWKAFEWSSLLAKIIPPQIPPPDHI